MTHGKLIHCCRTTLRLGRSPQMPPLSTCCQSGFLPPGSVGQRHPASLSRESTVLRPSGCISMGIPSLHRYGVGWRRRHIPRAQGKSHCIHWPVSLDSHGHPGRKHLLSSKLADYSGKAQLASPGRVWHLAPFPLHS